MQTCILSAEGTAGIAHELYHLTELRGLDMSHNSVDLAGARAVMASLKHCKHVESVFISYNHEARWQDGIFVEGLVLYLQKIALPYLI